MWILSSVAIQSHSIYGAPASKRGLRQIPSGGEHREREDGDIVGINGGKSNLSCVFSTDPASFLLVSFEMLFSIT